MEEASVDAVASPTSRIIELVSAIQEITYEESLTSLANSYRLPTATKGV